MRAGRTTDPYRDLDVIDSRAPRFNQATVGVLAVVALVTGWWWLVAILALQLAAGLLWGRRVCLPCLFYFEVVQPRFGEGEIEDSRPPRFANMMGAGCLGAATLAYLAEADLVGDILTVIVAALALLAAATGLCVGCEIYRIVARLRGVRPGIASRIDLTELGIPANGQIVVHFTHPLCSGCKQTEQRLAAEGHNVIPVDISKRPDLARKYHVALVPTAFAVRGDGAVVQRLA